MRPLTTTSALILFCFECNGFKIHQIDGMSYAKTSVFHYPGKHAIGLSTALQLFEKKIEPNQVMEEDSARIKNVELTTEKYGLEAGLFQSLKNDDGGVSAKELLKKYGIAYLATSIPLAIVSFTICYILVDSGVDVAGLLGKLGIPTEGIAEKAGTVAIAYAAHKAASPIRFPPTVILTPVVAKLIGKEPEESSA